MASLATSKQMLINLVEASIVHGPCSLAQLESAGLLYPASSSSTGSSPSALDEMPVMSCELMDCHFFPSSSNREGRSVVRFSLHLLNGQSGGFPADGINFAF